MRVSEFTEELCFMQVEDANYFESMKNVQLSRQAERRAGGGVPAAALSCLLPQLCSLKAVERSSAWANLSFVIIVSALKKKVKRPDETSREVKRNGKKAEAQGEVDVCPSLLAWPLCSGAPQGASRGPAHGVPVGAGRASLQAGAPESGVGLWDP